jgi:IMP cyclohydrolase
METTMAREAEANLEQLAANEYPGRLIIQGISAEGDFALQGYAIMGRSTGSRNRIFETFGEGFNLGVRTAPFETKPGEDHSLTIYNAMRDADLGRAHVATNGAQTDDIVRAINSVERTDRNALEVEQNRNLLGAFDEELHHWAYEPDEPNYTPRINGLLVLNDEVRQSPRVGAIDFRLAYMKKAVEGLRIERQIKSHRVLLDVNPQEGRGDCLHTYQTNGDPLPPFEGNPYVVPLQGNAQETADTYWDVLNNDNKVSLAVKEIDLVTGAVNIVLKNKHLGD